MKNPTDSVYELDENRYNKIFEIMKRMKIIMVKGIGYVVVNKNMDDPKLFRRVGDVVAVAYEDADKVPTKVTVTDFRTASGYAAILITNGIEFNCDPKYNAVIFNVKATMEVAMGHYERLMEHLILSQPANEDKS